MSISVYINNESLIYPPKDKIFNKVTKMATFTVDEERVEKILKYPLKIEDDISFDTHTNINFLRCDVKAKSLNYRGANLKVNVTINIDDNSIYSCSLFLNGIRWLCVKGTHSKNCLDDTTWTGETHKHKRRDECGDSWAYTPTDIDESSIKTVIYSFFNECNIKHYGNFQERLSVEQ